MATDLISFALYDASGAPLPGITASFLYYVDRTGASRTAPTIVDLTGGLYGFTPSASDKSTGVAFVVDATAAAATRYFSGSSSADSDPFAVVLLSAADGSLFVGSGSPSIVTYADPTGSSRTAPSVLLLAGACLFCFTPSASDLAVNVAWSMTSPAGAYPARLSGYLDGADAASAPVSIVRERSENIGSTVGVVGEGAIVVLLDA